MEDLKKQGLIKLLEQYLTDTANTLSPHDNARQMESTPVQEEHERKLDKYMVPFPKTKFNR